MKTKKFIADLVKLDEKDFDYMSAYTNRETGETMSLFGRPLEEVLPICRVCVSGYLMSLLGGEHTGEIRAHYDFAENQLAAIIHPECAVVFDDVEVESPLRTASLKEVIDYIKCLFLNPDFIEGDFLVEHSIEY